MLEINNTTKQKINLKKTHDLVEHFLNIYKKSNYNVSLAIIGEAKMKSLNKLYRGINKTTDVLSFPGLSKDLFLGEVIINIQETKKLSKYQEMFQSVGVVINKGMIHGDVYLFYFLLIHGLLHLIGYNDDTERGRFIMLKLGRDFLKKML